MALGFVDYQGLLTYISRIQASPRCMSGPRSCCRSCRISLRFSIFLDLSELISTSDPFCTSRHRSLSLFCGRIWGDHHFHFRVPPPSLSSSKPASYALSLMKAPNVAHSIGASTASVRAIGRKQHEIDRHSERVERHNGLVADPPRDRRWIVGRDSSWRRRPSGEHGRSCRQQLRT